MNLARTSGSSHGTYMLSKVVGHLYGIAKKANPIIVRVPRDEFVDGQLQKASAKPLDWFDGVLEVLKDVRPGEPGAGMPAVVSMSWGYPPVSNGKLLFPDFMDPTQDSSGKFAEELRDALKELVSMGVHIVTASGNNDEVRSFLSRSSSDGLISSSQQSLCGLPLLEKPMLEQITFQSCWSLVLLISKDGAPISRIRILRASLTSALLAMV